MYFRFVDAISGWRITIFPNFRIDAAVSYCNIGRISAISAWRGGFAWGYFVLECWPYFWFFPIFLQRRFLDSYKYLRRKSLKRNILSLKWPYWEEYCIAYRIESAILRKIKNAAHISPVVSLARNVSSVEIGLFWPLAPHGGDYLRNSLDISRRLWALYTIAYVWEL